MFGLKAVPDGTNQNHPQPGMLATLRTTRCHFDTHTFVSQENTLDQLKAVAAMNICSSHTSAHTHTQDVVGAVDILGVFIPNLFICDAMR